MPLSFTNYPNWVPASCVHWGVFGDILLAAEVRGDRRFVVWNLASNSRAAFEVTFDAGYAPPAAGTHTGAAISANGALWMPHYTTWWHMTRFNTDGSFDQWPSVVSTGIMSATTGTQVWCVKSGDELHILYRRSASSVEVIVFDLSTQTWATSATVVSGNHVPATRFIESGGRWFSVTTNGSVIIYNPATKTSSLVASTPGSISMSTGQNIQGVKLNGFLWWAGVNKFLRFDPVTNTSSVVSTPVPCNAPLVVFGGELVSAHLTLPATRLITGFDGVSSGWSDGPPPFMPFSLLVHGGDLIGLPA